MTAVGRGSSSTARRAVAGVEVVAPDLVGEDLREVEQPVGTHRRRVRPGEVIQQHPRLVAPGGVDLEEPAALAELVDEQAPAGVVHRHAVGGRQVVAHDAVRPVRVTGGDPAEHRLGGVERAVGAEDGVVGSGDATAERREDGVLAGVDIDRRDLRAEDLGDVEPTVGPERHPVGAAQPARRRHGLQPPPGGDLPAPRPCTSTSDPPVSTMPAIFLAPVTRGRSRASRPSASCGDSPQEALGQHETLGSRTHASAEHADPGQ